MIVLPCKRRRCPICGPERWKPYQQAKYMAGLDGVNPELVKVFTLTAPGDDVLPGPREIRLWNEGASDRWEKFVRLLREAYPAVDLEVWKVWEYQKRGALHAHGLVRGLKWIHMEVFRRCAVAAGFGPRIQLERCKVSRGGIRGLLGYFSKYLLKVVDAWNGANHVITSSRGWAIDWKKRRKVERESEWFWLTAKEAEVFVRSWVLVDTRSKGRSEVLGPPI